MFKKSKGSESKLAYLGHILMENRHGLVVRAKVTQATGMAEREAAAELVEALGGTQRITLGADKNYDTKGFVAELREMTVTPHVAQNDTNRSSAIDERTTRHPPPATRHPPPGLCHQPDDPQADRGMLWLGQDHWWFAQEPVYWPRETRLPVRDDVCGL